MWQAQKAGIWLASKVTVGVNAATGAVAYYATQLAPSKSLPRISTAAAARSAVLASGLVSPTILAGPELQLVGQNGSPRVMWVTELAAKQPHAVAIRDVRIVWTDPLSRQSQLVARS